MVGLGDLDGGGFFSNAWAVSTDGSVVVGEGDAEAGNEAFRWTSDGGMIGRDDSLDGGHWNEARGVSADGSVIVGRGTGPSASNAFRWTSGGGTTGLGDLPGGSNFSTAARVSADGSVVVGGGSGILGIEAFRWTSSGGIVGLGDLPGGDFFSNAAGVSADGGVVVDSDSLFLTTGGGRFLQEVSGTEENLVSAMRRTRLLPHMQVYRTKVPLYPGADFGFFLYSHDGVSLAEPVAAYQGRHYDPAVHRAAFALPPWQRDWLGL